MFEFFEIYAVLIIMTFSDQFNDSGLTLHIVFHNSERLIFKLLGIF